MARKHLFLCCFILFLCARVGQADILTFDSAAEWEAWEAPYGLIQVSEEGKLQLVKFRKDISAVQDAHQFRHLSRKSNEEVAGGIWEAGTDLSSADRIIDGDQQTYWQPDPDALLKDWFVQIDLGRAVLAKEIRLTFPDEEGARPFRQFTLFIATGGTSDPLDDLFIFRPAYRTIRPNEDASIVIPLEFAAQDSAMVMDPGLEVDPVKKNQYRVIQYINFTAEEQSEDAALAEIEVIAVGDNISLGIDRRGRVIDGLTAVSNSNLFDADMNTTNSISPVSFAGREDSWQRQGTWFYVDLGAVFWVDELFLYALREQEGNVGWLASPPQGFNFLYSDGTRSIGTELPVPEPLDYNELVIQENPAPNRYLRYLFKPRKMRYLFWHSHITAGWISKWAELMLFSPGHPARVVTRSPFIDLGQVVGDGHPKVIKALHWDADLSPHTRLQLRSRSGNTMEKMYTFYDKKGTVVTEEKWNSSPKVIRGPVDTMVVVSEDWGAWSNVYHFAGEDFKSESPRRFVQLEMILSTDDPSVAPVVNSLSIEYEDALLRQARGSILPRQASPNEETRFTYTLWPQNDTQDSGFDQLRFAVPGMTAVDEVEVTIGGQAVVPAQVSLAPDSLLIVLPQPVRADSVQARFTTRILRNATLFSLDLGLNERPGLWQSVEPAERRSNIVMLPELADSDRLIGDLEISPPLFTPNSDGVNDQVEIRFVPFKVDAVEPQVCIYDISGKRVAKLDQASAAGSSRAFTWSGRDGEGALVQPGIYLCRIDVGAETGEGVALRTIAVAY